MSAGNSRSSHALRDRATRKRISNACSESRLHMSRSMPNLRQRGRLPEDRSAKPTTPATCDLELAASDLELAASDLELAASDLELAASDLELAASDLELAAASR